MSRTAIYTALVLRNRPSGESNSEVTLLTAEEGIIKATVFGGPKSKLRAHSAPNNSGKVWIYRDKAKEYMKLSDFDVRSWRTGLRELYERTMTAYAVAETIITSHGGGGDWGIALKLAIDTLDTLENANEELCERLFVHFLWRWAAFLGIQPNLEVCASCGRDTEKDLNGNQLWFNVREGAVFCSACMQSACTVQQLNTGSRKWLSEAGMLEPEFLHRYSMDNKSLSEVKSLTTSILTGAFGKRPMSYNI